MSIATNLNAASQHLVEDVSPFLHDAHVVRRGVGALAVLDGIDEAVPELLDGAQQILLDEVHHAVVCRGVGGERNHAGLRYCAGSEPAGLRRIGWTGRPSHSMRLFCRGVPVSTTRLRVLMEFMAFDTADASFFKM